MGNKSIIYNFTVEQIKEILDTSNSIVEVLKAIGFKRPDGGSARTILYNYIQQNNLNEYLDKIKIRARKKQGMFGGSPRASYEECFCEESKIARHSVKSRIIKDSLIEYKCAICGNTGEWNDQKLVLQLDHINCINNDNRLENLRFLCPNCHSQTKTYSGKHNMGS